MSRGIHDLFRGITGRFQPPDPSPTARTSEPDAAHGSPNPQSASRNPQFSAWLPAVTPNWEWQVPHLRLLQDELQAVTEGRVDRLMLFLPPRHGKSELATVRYPVFRLEQKPDLKVIIGAYNQALAERFSRKARRIAYRERTLSPGLRGRGGFRNAACDWETTEGGGVRAVGVGSGVTGLGADLILIDDPVKSREEADSATYRDRVWDWYRDDLYTRQEPGCAIILVMTRWHEDDLAGRILASEEGPSWRVVRVPALAESEAEYRAWAEMQSEKWRMQSANREDGAGPSHFPLLTSHFSLTDPLGREEGEPLWPSRFNRQALDRIRTALGNRSFAALYQGRPMPAEGGLFKREWFKIVDGLPEPVPDSPPAPAAEPAEPAPNPWVPELPEDATPLERKRHARRVARGDFDPLPPLIPARERADHELRRRLAAFQESQPAIRSRQSAARWVRFWDTAAKAGERCDYWAGALLVRLPEGQWCLVDVVRGRWEYPEAKRRVLQTAARDGCHVPVVIEESANGIALLQDLAADPRAGGYWIRAEKAVGDKAVRAGAWSSAAEMGRFHLVRAPWNAAFLAEVEAFPHGAHDDQVDAVSGAYGYLFRQSRRPRITSLCGPAR